MAITTHQYSVASVIQSSVVIRLHLLLYPKCVTEMLDGETRLYRVRKKYGNILSFTDTVWTQIFHKSPFSCRRR